MYDLVFRQQCLELTSSHGQTIQGPLELYSCVKAAYEQGEFQPWTKPRISKITVTVKIMGYSLSSGRFQFGIVCDTLNYLPTFTKFQMLSLEKVSLTALKDYDICHDNITSWYVMTTCMTFPDLYADEDRP